MAYFEEEKRIRTEVMSKLEPLTRIDPETLISAEYMVQLNMVEDIVYLKHLLGACRDLYEIELDDIPKVILSNTVNPFVTQINDCINKISNFSIYQETLERLRQHFGELYSIYEGTYTNIVPIITAKRVKQSNIRSLRQELKQFQQDVAIAVNERVNELSATNQKFQHIFTSEVNAKIDGLLDANRKQLEIAKNEYEQRLAEVDNLKSQVQSLIKDAAIAIHAEHFGNEAAFHTDEAKFWNKLILAISVAIFLFAGYNIFFPPNFTGDHITPVYVSQILIPRGTLLIILLYLLSWGVKNQSAHKHNFVVNKHRQNALNTFQAFGEATENDPDIRNAILLQATQCIFSTQPSGYIGKEPEADGTSKVIEIFKSSVNK
jgi:hypothetical protein